MFKQILFFILFSIDTFCTINLNYIALEGNFGAGKTTLLKQLSQECDIIVPIYEPVAKWQNVNNKGNIYHLFFQDTKRWAFTMEVYVLFSRIFAQVEALKNNKTTEKLQIIDHSIYADYYCWAKPLLDSKTMSTIEWQIYKDIFLNTTKHIITKPRAFIYLKTDPKVSYQRAINRGRPEDKTIPFSFWQSLHDYHEKLLIKRNQKSLKNMPILVLDGNIDINKNPNIIKQHISKIKNFIEQFTNNNK